MMNVFRHPPLAAWSAILLTLLALLVGALRVADGATSLPVGDGSVPGVPAQSSQAKDEVIALRALMGSGLAAGADPAALHAFGSRAVALTDAALAARGGEGAGDGDPLLRTLQHARAAAGTVTTAPQVTVAASARSQLMLDVDTASALVSGLPMPTGGIPAAPADQGSPDQPVASNPPGPDPVTLPRHADPVSPPNSLRRPATSLSPAPRPAAPARPVVPSSERSGS